MELKFTRVWANSNTSHARPVQNAGRLLYGRACASRKPASIMQLLQPCSLDAAPFLAPTSTRMAFAREPLPASTRCDGGARTKGQERFERARGGRGGTGERGMGARSAWVRAAVLGSGRSA